MVVHRQLAVAALLVLLVLASGCGKPPSLAEPGGRQVIFQLWDSPALPPMVIQADQLLQVEAGSFDRLRFINVTVRRPMADGVLVMSAPSGDFQRRPQSVMELQGPVRISGELQGEPVIGAADSARILRPEEAGGGGRPDTVQVELIGGTPIEDPERQAVLLFQGMAVRSPRFTATGTSATGKRGLAIVSDAPSLIDEGLPDLATVLAGLPHPLVLPAVLPHLGP